MILLSKCIRYAMVTPDIKKDLNSDTSVAGNSTVISSSSFCNILAPTVSEYFPLKDFSNH